MGITLEITKVWNEELQGNNITSALIQDCIYDKIRKTFPRQNIGSILARFARTGYAKKINRGIYRKLKDYESERTKTGKVITKPVKPSEETFTTTELGESVLKIIERLKDHLMEQKAFHKQSIEELKSMKIAYQQAQQKIIELNTQLNSKKPRSVKLEDLQNMAKTGD